MADVNELRELGNDDLAQREKDLDDQVFRLRLQEGMGQGETPNKMRLLRRERAQVKTVLRERQLAAAGDERAAVDERERATDTKGDG